MAAAAFLQVSAGEIVSSVRHHEKNCFDQNYEAESPLQSGEGVMHTLISVHGFPFYYFALDFSLDRFRGARALISRRR